MFFLVPFAAEAVEAFVAGATAAATVYKKSK